MVNYLTLGAEINVLKNELAKKEAQLIHLNSLEERFRLAVILYSMEGEDNYNWSSIGDDAPLKDWLAAPVRKQYLDKADKYLMIVSYEDALRIISI